VQAGVLLEWDFLLRRLQEGRNHRDDGCRPSQVRAGAPRLLR